jgi:hypothetical protein
MVLQLFTNLHITVSDQSLTQHFLFRLSLDLEANSTNFLLYNQTRYSLYTTSDFLKNLPHVCAMQHTVLSSESKIASSGSLTQGQFVATISGTVQFSPSFDLLQALLSIQ